MRRRFWRIGDLEAANSELLDGVSSRRFSSSSLLFLNSTVHLLLPLSGEVVLRLVEICVFSAVGGVLGYPDVRGLRFWIRDSLSFVFAQIRWQALSASSSFGFGSLLSVVVAMVVA